MRPLKKRRTLMDNEVHESQQDVNGAEDDEEDSSEVVAKGPHPEQPPGSQVTAGHLRYKVGTHPANDN